MFGLSSLSDDVRALALRQSGPSEMRRLEARLRLVTGRGGCKHPDGTARFVSTGLASFEEEVALHLARRCSVAGHRSADPDLLPVPAARLALVDTAGRDFS